MDTHTGHHQAGLQHHRHSLVSHHTEEDDEDDDDEDDDEEEEEDSLAGSHNAPAGSSFDYFSSVGNQSHQVSCQFHWPLIEIRGHISIHIDSSCGRIKLNTEYYPKGVFLLIKYFRVWFI